MTFAENIKRICLERGTNLTALVKKGRRIVLTFNVSGQNTATLSCSDIACSAPPNSANPNTLFFVKHCFGFVLQKEEVH